MYYEERYATTLNYRNQILIESILCLYLLLGINSCLINFLSYMEQLFGII